LIALHHQLKLLESYSKAKYCKKNNYKQRKEKKIISIPVKLFD
jgi:hypothetical protein